MSEKILHAITQAWCAPENEHKEMDATLASTIHDNVMKEVQQLLKEQREACAEIVVNKVYEWCDDTYTIDSTAIESIILNATIKGESE